jgi:hypothetical protein
MDLLTALWYVDYTAGQLGMFERDGFWYLHYRDCPQTAGMAGVR